MKKNESLGINMKAWCRAHEREMNAVLESLGSADSGDSGSSGSFSVPKEILEEHLEKIRWLQHERLVHLIVTVMCTFIEVFVVAVVLLLPVLQKSGLGTGNSWMGVLPAVIMLGFAVLLGFYYYHYFFLENTVQRWYVIAEKMQALIGE